MLKIAKYTQKTLIGIGNVLRNKASQVRTGQSFYALAQIVKYYRFPCHKQDTWLSTLATKTAEQTNEAFLYYQVLGSAFYTFACYVGGTCLVRL